MILKAIEVRTGLRTVDQEMRGTETELDVRLRYASTSLEVSQVAALLQPGTVAPPQEFWDALDFGQTGPPVEAASMVVTVTPVMPDGSRGLSKVVLMSADQTISIPVTWGGRAGDKEKYSATVEVHAAAE